ncbi:MAG: phosphoglucosamine mutase [Clostridiaceae bacterium]|nr:phosphoglucosamine mutase [Clostridiaceae bacterium]
MGRLFGTDGVRGIANKELTCELAFQLGKAGAYVLAEESKLTPRIVIGKDTRRSGDMLEKALIAGICSAGAEAICLGVISTPAVAYLTRKYKADAGVVISASHNPAEFNGIKFFDRHGYKLSDSLEERIEAIILENAEKLPNPVGCSVGCVTEIKEAKEDYISFLKNSVNTSFEGLKIALDCANGAAFETAPKVFCELGADVIVINNAPDGLNINGNCGSTHMEMLKSVVLENKCDLGFAFDGDADRVLAVDSDGNYVDGDKILGIIGLELKKQNKLPNNTIVATVMSNLGLDIMAKEYGLCLEKTKVGDRYVLEQMLKKGHMLGGEQSGHIVMLNFNTTGDGQLTALQLVQIIKNTGKTLKELASVMKVYPQVLKNAKVKNENKFRYMEDPEIAARCRELEKTFHGEGRVLIRPSGTEPLVRVMIEGKEHDYIARKAEELAKFIEQKLG